MTALDIALQSPKRLSFRQIADMVANDDEGLWRETFAASREVKERCGKTDVLPRGLVECSNVCAKDCFYCGIRKGNAKAIRYRMCISDVLACVEDARRRGYPAIAFQAGEIESEDNTHYYEDILAACGGLEVTLSLGEQTEDVYRRWKDAGAMRYLLRIETSNRTLFSKVHPADCSFDRRLACLRTLKRLGYVTGSGVMVGLPGQTTDDLARDIVFYGEESLDMVGMGPYVPHPDTPLAKTASIGGHLSPGRLLDLTCRMIALTRIQLWDVNIVAATALEVLDPRDGRRRAIDAGANVVMPVLTPETHRRGYDLYPGKSTASIPSGRRIERG